jgi:hypothetical protein
VEVQGIGGVGLAGIGECKEMQRKQKLLGARSQQQRKGRVSPAKISDRASLNEDVDDDPQLSPEWIRELKRRVKDSRDPVRYMLVSEFSPKFILYYDVTSDTYVMNDPSRGTLFKRRDAAESVRALLGKGVAIVRFTIKGGKLKRLSPFRGLRSRRQRKPT